MKFNVYTRMEFCKEIEADSWDEAYKIVAGGIDYDWEDCYEDVVEDVQEVY